MTVIYEQEYSEARRLPQIAEQIWIFRKTGARYKIIKARLRWAGTPDPVLEEMMLENIESQRRHWITMKGLLEKYDKEVSP